jgi:hypothetical protein
MAHSVATGAGDYIAGHPAADLTVRGREVRAVDPTTAGGPVDRHAPRTGTSTRTAVDAL